MVKADYGFLGTPKGEGLASCGCNVGVLERVSVFVVVPKEGAEEEARSQVCQLLESSQLSRYVAGEAIRFKFSVRPTPPESRKIKRAVLAGRGVFALLCGAQGEGGGERRGIAHR